MNEERKLLRDKFRGFQINIEHECSQKNVEVEVGNHCRKVENCVTDVERVGGVVQNGNRTRR